MVLDPQNIALGILVIELFVLIRKVGAAMAVFTDLTTLLTGVAADVEVIAAHEAAEPPTVVTQAQLDEATAQAQALKDRTAAIVAGLPPPTP